MTTTGDVPIAEKKPRESWFHLFSDIRIITLLFLGISSGLPLALTASTLAIRLVEAGVNKADIGLFAAMAIPYSFKFVWAPLVDSLPFPLLTRLLGRRRGWLIGAQACLMASIIFMGTVDPAIAPWFTALAALLVAFWSATQDILVDAYRVELLPTEKQGTAAATYVLGYRLGMIASSAGALHLDATMGWSATYTIMGLLIGFGMIAALIAGEPKVIAANTIAAIRGSWIQRALIAPFRDFMSRPGWLIVLCFTALYKLPDAFIGLMSSVFFIELGFTKPEIADISKLYGLIATIAGGFLGGWLMTRFRLITLLWTIGLAQGFTNLLYITFTYTGAQLSVLALVITGDNLVSGMSATVFVAYLSGLCNARFTATQYALLSSLASASRTMLSTPAGWCAATLGWTWFFGLSALLPLPSLILLIWLQKNSRQKSAD